MMQANEMNKLTREHYPASRLPDDLRGQIDPSRHVTITIVEEEAPRRKRSFAEIFEDTKEFRTRTPAEIDASIRAQRDEWDD
jgi:hypothetical protein